MTMEILNNFDSIYCFITFVIGAVFMLAMLSIAAMCKVKEPRNKVRFYVTCELNYRGEIIRRIYFNYFNTFYNVTREEAKELLPIIQAWAEGKNIQFLSDGEWHDINQADFTCYPDKYRIKPESKYRPFKTQEECWNEMMKHHPFGFVVSKDSIDYSGICRVFKDEKGISRITFTSNPYSDWDMEIAFYRINFADGTPFGIREE